MQHHADQTKWAHRGQGGISGMARTKSIVLVEALADMKIVANKNKKEQWITNKKVKRSADRGSGRYQCGARAEKLKKQKEVQELLNASVERALFGDVQDVQVVPKKRRSGRYKPGSRAASERARKAEIERLKELLNKALQPVDGNDVQALCIPLEEV